MTQNLIQRSPEWHSERLGSIGASEVFDATDTLKTGANKGRPSEKAEDVIIKKVIERITGASVGRSLDGIPAVRHGVENEAMARTEYEFRFGVAVNEVGLFKHNRIAWTHASPDGVRSDSNVGIEIKCPEPKTHWRALVDGVVSEKYRTQCLWQMAVCGFEAVDYVSFYPMFPEAARLAVIRIERDEDAISELEGKVEAVLAEIARREADFRQRFLMKEAAE